MRAIAWSALVLFLVASGMEIEAQLRQPVFVVRL